MKLTFILASLVILLITTHAKSQRFLAVGDNICCETLDKLGRLSRSWISENDCMNLNGIDLNYKSEIECVRDNVDLVKKGGFKIYDVCCKFENNGKSEFDWTTNLRCKSSGGLETTIKDSYSCMRAQRIPNEPIRTDICCIKFSTEGEMSYIWMNKVKCLEENGSESYPSEKDECEIWDPKNKAKRDEFFKQICCKVWRLDGRSSFKWINRKSCKTERGEENDSFNDKEQCLSINNK